MLRIRSCSVTFLFWKVDIEITSSFNTFTQKVEMFIKRHKKCIINLLRGELYRTLDGRIFKYRKYVPYYTAGMPGDVDLTYWHNKPTLKANSLSLSMVHSPAFIFKDGKRIAVTSKRDAHEYAKRNNLVFGGDDLEQESSRNRANLDREANEKITNSVMDAFVNKCQRR